MVANPVRVNIGYFLEDIAQEHFVTTLVVKIAASLAIMPESITIDVRNAVGGSGRAIQSFQAFLQRFERDGVAPYDLLVVAVDGNCIGYNTRRQVLLEEVQRHSYPGYVALAVPDPHVEKWYLADPEGFRAAFGGQGLPVVPKHKCEKDRYKRALAEALSAAGVEAPLGGAEYGKEIVQGMDLGRAENGDRSLRAFVRDVRAALRSLGGR